MALHSSTFEYLQPTDEQIASMAQMREEFAYLAGAVEKHIPDGADKTYILRKVREIGMWANVAITREADGTPRA